MDVLTSFHRISRKSKPGCAHSALYLRHKLNGYFCLQYPPLLNYTTIKVFVYKKSNYVRDTTALTMFCSVLQTLTKHPFIDKSKHVSALQRRATSATLLPWNSPLYLCTYLSPWRPPRLWATKKQRTARRLCLLLTNTAMVYRLVPYTRTPTT